jgi:NAD(P)-dependent dehydrogenase (short-subunit alcohol dehydrogenase family)
MAIKDFSGRVAVITGGAAGIGKALAQELTSLGAQVAIADLPGDRLEKTAAELGLLGVGTDVSNGGSVEALAKTVQERFGRVDLVVNNAGVGLQQSFRQARLKDWQWIFDVNFWGVVNGVNAFLPLLRQNPEGGHMVNTASLLGLYTMPGMGAYCASKAAVMALSETLAQELAVGGEPIGVTAFCPGPVDTTIQESLGRRDARYGAPRLEADPNDPVERAFLAVDNIEKMSALTAARIALDAVREGRFWAITHPEYTQPRLDSHQQFLAAVELQKTWREN